MSCPIRTKLRQSIVKSAPELKGERGVASGRTRGEAGQGSLQVQQEGAEGQRTGQGAPEGGQEDA